MSDRLELNGSCLCGAIRVTATGASKHVGACHCGMCRKWGGGPVMAIDCGTGVSFEGEKHVGIFDSSAWAQRGFCKICGSHLFYRLRESGQYFVPAGLFGDGEAFIFDHQVFVDERPAYYAFANETKDMTGAEVFAKFAPPSE